MASPPYYTLDQLSDEMMLLYDPAPPNDDDAWWEGVNIRTPPQEPVVVTICTGFEQSELMQYFNSANLMTNEMFDCLLRAGVDNLQGWDAVIRSEDGSVEHKGYKIFNLIGLIAAADLTKTEFNPENPSRHFDASIEKLVIDPNKTRGAQMFRLAEFVGAVLIHDRIKRALEAGGFTKLKFGDPAEYFTG
jgi:hypothetical protein